MDILEEEEDDDDNQPLEIDLNEDSDSVDDSEEIQPPIKKQRRFSTLDEQGAMQYLQNKLNTI